MKNETGGECVLYFCFPFNSTKNWANCMCEHPKHIIAHQAHALAHFIEIIGAKNTIWTTIYKYRWMIVLKFKVFVYANEIVCVIQNLTFNRCKFEEKKEWKHTRRTKARENQQEQCIGLCGNFIWMQLTDQFFECISNILFCFFFARNLINIGLQAKCILVLGFSMPSKMNSIIVCSIHSLKCIDKLININACARLYKVHYENILELPSLFILRKVIYTHMKLKSFYELIATQQWVCEWASERGSERNANAGNNQL